MSSYLAAVPAVATTAGTPAGYPAEDLAAALRWLAAEAQRLHDLVIAATAQPTSPAPVAQPPVDAAVPVLTASDVRRLCAERGWSVGRLICELRRAAQTRGASVPDHDSLKRTVIRWRTGRTTGLSPFYADLLSDVFGARFTHRQPPLAVAR